MAESVLLEAADRRYRLIEALAGRLRDKRQAGKMPLDRNPITGRNLASRPTGHVTDSNIGRLKLV